MKSSSSNLDRKAKITEFMKSNFGDRVSVATFAQPDPAESGVEEKPDKIDNEEFVFKFRSEGEDYRVHEIELRRSRFGRDFRSTRPGRIGRRGKAGQDRQ